MKKGISLIVLIITIIVIIILATIMIVTIQDSNVFDKAKIAADLYNGKSVHEIIKGEVLDVQVTNSNLKVSQEFATKLQEKLNKDYPGKANVTYYDNINNIDISFEHDKIYNFRIDGKMKLASIEKSGVVKPVAGDENLWQVAPDSQNDNCYKITGYTGTGEKLNNVTIPNEINGKKITSIAWYGTKAPDFVGTLTIANGITKINSYKGYSNLTNIIIPGSVTFLGVAFLAECKSLKYIEIAPDNTKYSSIDGVLFNKNKTEIESFPIGRGGSYTIPDGVQKIDYNAFQKCSNLTTVIIPSSTISIDSSAFSGCTGLTNIEIAPDNTKYSSIDGVLFNKNKTEIVMVSEGKSGSYTIPNSVTSMESGAFSGCTNLTNITIPDSVTYIDDSTFVGCEGLTTVTIPESVTRIGAWAFRACIGLTTVTIPEGITRIGQSAFLDCINLKNVTLPNSLIDIQPNAFNSCYNVTVGNDKVKALLLQSGYYRTIIGP